MPALDFAIAHGIPHGGWCPKGRLAEDGTIAACYALKESTSASYPQRTEWNVRDSDGTVIFTVGPTLAGGSKKTAEFAANRGKPLLHVNVAESRASKEPTVGDFVLDGFNYASRDFYRHDLVLDRKGTSF